ncbi:methionine--tRNA ligase [Candidatus Peregrinibacteria bacterium]|nr:methionine--tRNA ligase [Candidatus Peregrinibacteria bacterium]
MPKSFYITTAIAYVNGAPHVGHALELVQGDVIARYHRLLGDDTYFLTGTDEHGQKLSFLAEKEGTTPQAIADKNSALFSNIVQRLNISNDFFIRTTADFHTSACQVLWKKLVAAGDIYQGVYEGYYCVGCEAFILEKDLVDGVCPIHKKSPELLQEENYFFRLSKYSDTIRRLISTDELHIFPESRKKEMLNIIGEEGLRDVSFSRPRKVLNWGVAVPDDPDQVMYVWCDALANYITALDYEHNGERFLKYWPANVQLIGKDILRFHAGIWIGMLLSAGIAVPKNMYVHGFITSEGQKMSKSLGNVVDPSEYVNEFGVDSFRYYLLKEIPTGDDGDFSRRRFVELYSADLANGLGNLTQRVLTMAEKYFSSKVARPEGFSDDEIESLVNDVWKNYQGFFGNFELKSALESVWKLVEYANQYVDRKKPWVMAKENPSELQRVLYALLEILRLIALLMAPFLPETSGRIFFNLGIGGKEMGFLSNVVFGKHEKYTISKGEALFPRVLPS